MDELYNMWVISQYIFLKKDMKSNENRGRHEVIIHATIRKNLENIKIIERCQTQKAIYCMISFKLNVQNR